MSVVLAGGGTAGHVEPAMAVADALVALDPQVRITALGTARGLETQLVPERGYSLELITPVPLPRKPTGDLVRLPLRIFRAIRQTRAVLDNSGPRTCYVRGDAGTLPFGDETFDAVCCFGALYLMPEPFRVADEMVRVLRPGGRAAILTSYGGQSAPVRHVLAAGAQVIGLRMFDRHAFVDLFGSAGLVDVDQQTQRSLQFVTARKPGGQAIE